MIVYMGALMVIVARGLEVFPVLKRDADLPNRRL